MLDNDIEFCRLQDQLKCIVKTIKIVRDENNPSNKLYACGLAVDLLNHFYRDLAIAFGKPSNYNESVIDQEKES